MPGSKSYPSLPPNVDPIKAKVPLGGYVCRAEGISFHAKLKVTRLQVRNTGDRPVQVGSHFHFFEANRALEFDRPAAFGLHLNIPSATALRFEPGDEREVQLVPFQGQRGIYGFNNLVDGPTSGKAAADSKKKAVAAAARRGFRSATSEGTTKSTSKNVSRSPAAKSRGKKSGKR